MTDADFLDQLESWALGGLEAEPRRAMERHLASRPALAEATRRAFAIAAALGEALPPSPPPPEVWPRVVAEIRAAGGRGTTATADTRWRAKRRVGVAWGIAALAAAAALWLWLDRRDRVARGELLGRDLRAREAELATQRARLDTALAAQAQLDRCARELEAMRGRDALASDAVALLELAGTQLIALEPRTRVNAGQPALAANAIYHRGVKKAYVVARGLPADGTYRVWVTRGGQRVPGASIAAAADGTAIASVSTASLAEVPESFEITRDGALVLQSRSKI
jgi:hypothetical protein